MTTRIALLTIGQSPRSDVVPEIRGSLPYDVEVLETGALDGLSLDEIARKAPKAPDRTLVTRLRDGREVQIDKAFADRRLREMAAGVADRVDLIGLLCSATFEGIPCRQPLVLPSALLRGFLGSVRFPRPLGVVMPSSDQIDPVIGEFRSWGLQAIGVALSPYAPARDHKPLIDELRGADVGAIILDCFGYTQAIRQSFAQALGCPAISVRSLFIGALRELVGAPEITRTSHRELAADNRPRTSEASE